MSGSEPDDEFEAYLKQRPPVDQRKTPPESLEPPPELDRVVIGKARRAIQGPTPLLHFRAPGWALPVGLAATIVISFSVMLELGVRAAKQKDGLVVASQKTNASTATNEAASPAAASASGRQAESSTPTAALPRIATAPWPPVRRPASSSEPTITAIDPSVRDETRARVAQREHAAMRLESYSAPGTPTNSPTSAVPPTPAPPEASAPSKPASPPDPAAWLLQIEKLRTDGRATQAGQEFKRFREAYPDYPVPAARSADGEMQ